MTCEHPVGNVVSLEGVVEIRAAVSGQPASWAPARLQQPVCPDDQVAARAHSRVAIQLVNQVVVRLDQHTTLTLMKVDVNQPAQLGLLEGAAHFLSRFTRKLSVITPYLNAMVEGTEFTVAADTQAQRGQITVSEGRVRAVNQRGAQVLLAGNTVAAGAADAPSAPLTIHPRDAIRWALYYPQIVHLDDEAFAALDDASRSTLTAARQLAQRGQYSRALSLLDTVPEARLAPALRTWHANLLLSVGRLDEARAVLGELPCLPLRSLIETVLGNTQRALQLAQQASAEDRNSAAAALSLSLAWQAQGALPPAVDAARRATMLDGSFPLAWVRVAELELLNANARQGRDLAAHALQLDRNTFKAHTVIGFAELMAGHYGAAAQAFEQAKQGEAPDAQAWLGSGLVLIHGGQLATGREHLEIAAMLDPGNAELRNTLARAYAREDRDAAAGKELALARELDPVNPGPWFTEALRKQRLNDPVGALHAYQQSLRLNDYRAVVRPRSLLDQDKAGRMVSLASTYRDLGFDGLMLTTAERAVAADPGSAAAHALLAEAYGAMPQYEAARVSEQLQAQMRAPIGMAPVPPQSLLTTLPIVGGPRALTLQEFTPLLDRNRAALLAGALLGNESTYGTSLSAFKAWDKVQLSTGHFYYDTDIASNGRPIRLRANNLLLQAQLMPALQVQLEGRTERRDGGDVTQRINPLSNKIERNYLKNDSVRLGLLHELSAQSQWLLSAVHQERFGITDRVAAIPALGATVRGDLQTPTVANYAESQIVLQRGRWDFIAGAGLYRDRAEIRGHVVIAPPILPSPGDTTDDVSASHRDAYAYAGYRTGGWRLDSGLAWEDFEREDGFAVRRLNPKIGVEYAWQATRLHAALFKGVKGARAQEQSLASTQFAGFNQLFDDPDGTRYRRAAVGLDHDWHAGLSGGVEWSQRRMDIPNYGCTSVPCFAPWREQAHRLYGSWAIGPRWAVAAMTSYDSSRVEILQNNDFPIETHTWQLPVKLSYFPRFRWQLNLEWRAVEQTVRNQESAGASADRIVTAHSSFGLANASIRYGSPVNGWSAALEVNNALDRHFRYQGTTIGGDPTVPLSVPERFVTLRSSVRW